jgi:hypothetical protein
MISYRHGGRNTNLFKKDSDMTNVKYFISSGLGNKMYTLRVKFVERVYMGYHMGTRSVLRNQHVCTLSNDKDKAIAKAQERVGGEFEIGFEVFERAKNEKGNLPEVPANAVRFGKYAGKTVEEIKEIDPNYLMWVAENFTSKKHKAVIEYIQKVMKPAFEERDAKAQVEAVLDAEYDKERAEVLKEVGEELVKLPWNFPQSIGADLIKGQLPKGRGRHLVCDMMGKRIGRRNSKKYKAEYARVEAIIELAEAV